ncbi:DUF429 domain-containing protein [Ideonella sp. B508-1]|uniref:DUF429 domain-containing protein n=1 Tax=Ideonella sp. B508-1 TaxID=137716 RepID=UPI00034DA67F|nr:DUF429 domain-containing protein [Ideonella sp. B508-1]
MDSLNATPAAARSVFPPLPCALAALPLLGVDFSSAPSRQKPVVLAGGRRSGAVVKLDSIERFSTLPALARAAVRAPPLAGRLDLPFGLPRPLLEAWGWPLDWAEAMSRYVRTPRPELQAAFAAFCAARPVGQKFAHRVCDGPAGASPSMKWVNPPVAWMMHAGVPLLRAAGVTLVGHAAGDPARLALEAYPGLLARAVLGRRSYKSDEKAKQTPERLIARKDLVDALEQGRQPWGLRLRLSHAQREALVEDARGDTLDAVLCLLQAAWGAGQPRGGWPEDADALEGWILGAGAVPAL